MKIDSEKNGSALTVKVEGRLDTVTSPQLEAFLTENLPGITGLTFDFGGLEYISSSGLRTLLKAQKQMNAVGSMKVCHVGEIVREVFSVTGFDTVLTIED